MKTFWAVLTEDEVDKTFTLVEIFDTHSKAESLRKRKPAKYILSKICSDDILTKTINGHRMKTPVPLALRVLRGN